MKSLLTHNDVLEKEDDEGNIEYKWRLINLDKEKLIQYSNQMKFRITEGEGKAIYEIGINDDGVLIGLNEKDFKETVENFNKIVNEIGATSEVLCEKIVNDYGDKVIEFLVSDISKNEYIDLRIGLLGDTGAGKSTFMSVITNGVLDNGCGSMKVHSLQHIHELSSGYTSSISYDLLGFKNNKVTNYDLFGKLTWKDIVKESSKISTLIDLCGNEKYFGTTINYVSCDMIDYIFLFVDENITKITKKHLLLGLGMKIPILMIINKIDIMNEKMLRKIKNDVINLIKSVKKIPYFVNDFLNYKISLNMIPVIQFSNVTGNGKELIEQIINKLTVNKKIPRTNKVEFIIEKYLMINDKCIIIGYIVSGEIKSKDILFIGPFKNGEFKEIKINDIQRKKVYVTRGLNGQHVSFLLDYKGYDIKKGMVMVSKDNMCSTREFKVLVKSLNKNMNKQITIHTRFIKQRAIIKEIKGNIITFKLLNEPCFIKKGMKIIIQDINIISHGLVKDII